MLLRKIREHKEINKCANKKHSAINGKREDERLSQLSVSTERCDLQNQPEDRQPTCVKPVFIKPKMDNQITNQITKKQRYCILYCILCWLQEIITSKAP